MEVAVHTERAEKVQAGHHGNAIQESSPQTEKPRISEKLKQRIFNEIQCSSASEAALTVLNEAYLKNFRYEHGRSGQVAVQTAADGHNQYVLDWVIAGHPVEFHHVVLPRRGSLGDFQSPEERAEFFREYDALNTSRKEVHWARKVRDVTDRLRADRQATLAYHRTFGGKEVIVVCTPEEYYRKVARRFGNAHLPPQGEFVKQFHELRTEYKKLRKRRDGTTSTKRSGGPSKSSSRRRTTPRYRQAAYQARNGFYR